MASSRDPARLRQGLVPLTTTALGPYGAQVNTPISAISMSSSHLQSAQTPGSAIQPYNPQEWVSSPAAATSESQAPAPPPPPYSPPRSQQQRSASAAFDQSPAATSTPPPATRSSMATLHRPSPEPLANRSFPPPPGVGGRGGSRERRFLPSLGWRRDLDRRDSDQISPQSIPLARQSMGPIQFQALERDQTSAASSMPFTPVEPPAARRAASTGAIETPTSARSRSASQTRWEPGMPLPPPPPGPPPTGSRPQSVQPLERNTVPIIAVPTKKPPPTGVTSLGPVPPTPAHWVDSDHPQKSAARGRSPGLTIDTDTANSPSQAFEPPMPSSSSASGLNRAKAVRHDKTIIQRRTESRTGTGGRGSIDARIEPHAISDIEVPGSSSTLASRLITGKSTPRSGPDAPRTGDSSDQQDSHNSTPRATGSAKLPQLDTVSTATPPFSPYPPKLFQSATAQNVGGSQSSVPKALPTPPPQVRSASSSGPRDVSRPPPAATTPASRHVVLSQTAEQFAAAAVERFQAFAAKEAVVATDADRVRLFADFIVGESRIRRERYSSAIGAMGSEIFDLTRDLFRPMTSTTRESGTSQGEWTPESSEPNRSHRGSMSSYRGEGGSSSAPSSAKLPTSPTGGPPGNANWNSNYMPSLSPILSMSVSENYENGSSRGRQTSRWWESDSQGDPSRGIERSKRESKYMGVPKDQWVDAIAESPAVPGTTNEHGKLSVYPPEKTGLHEEHLPSSGTPQPLGSSNGQTHTSPSPVPTGRGQLDVSRLVTLPPPYPRHHPAVNNNHPELASIRASVRTLTDLSEMDNTKEMFAIDSSKRREGFSKAASERRRSLRANLQQEVSSGNIGYADAAAIESDSQEQERDKAKDLEKTEYEHFQNQVILPLNGLLSERISRASDLFDDLSRHLFDNGQNDADMPQEEGDDRPELLEKLTLLKRIFETREALHKAIYDLLSDRNSRYCEVVLTPYRLTGNTEKLRSAEAFFAEDATKREFAFAIEVLNRNREFRGVVEEAVERGVTLQLSAFWDIAPPLRRVLDKIPQELEGFSIQIPAREFEENPAYVAHPMQYLFSLLLHAEKSTYQFIEAHTNLLCLLHEVKEAVVNAKARVLATQTVESSSAGGAPISATEREERAQQMRLGEERRLTEDLKEKVREVHDQWHSALSESLESVKERTGEWLLQTGGWDETFEEGGVRDV